jgi:peroxin-12
MLTHFQTLAAKMRRFFKNAYPWINTAFEVWLLISNVAYLFDKTPFYRPWLRWIGVDIRRMGAEDMVCSIVLSVVFYMSNS